MFVHHSCRQSDCFDLRGLINANVAGASYKLTYFPSLGPWGPVGLLPALMSARTCVCVCVCVCVSTGFVPVTIKPVVSWRGDLADCQVWPCKAMVRRCHSMVTCCQKARNDSWKPLPAPGQTWVKSVLRGSFRKAQRGPHAKRLVFVRR